MSKQIAYRIPFEEIKVEYKEPIILGPGGQCPRPPIDVFFQANKKLRVTPAELLAASQKLASISESYTSIYNQLMQQAQMMGAAWEGADNQAFVEQISGFGEELKSMAEKINTASQALRTQAQNYENRQNDNIAQVKKLTR